MLQNSPFTLPAQKREAAVPLFQADDAMHWQSSRSQASSGRLSSSPHPHQKEVRWEGGRCTSLRPPGGAQPLTHLPPGHDPYHFPQLCDKSPLQVQHLKEVVGLQEEEKKKRCLRGEAPSQKPLPQWNPPLKTLPGPVPQSISPLHG